jgi:catechol 2,3-dioxygenase-like lactoylglutathione lyase family enzyme
MDFKLELVTMPVTDVDRAKAFYESAGFNADHDHRVDENLRFVQLTPPGSACSISLGEGLTEAEPGSVKGMMMVVSDIEAARETLAGGGVRVSEVDRQPWGDFVYFADPDGNTWAVQQLPDRG